MVNSPSWPADKVERRSVVALVPYAKNARTHSEAQIAQVAASIAKWGWTTPVLIDELDGIVAGHARVLAAKKLNIGDVPVIVARGWTEAQKRAYILADNKLAMNAGWDEAILAVELDALRALDFDLALIGFNADELKAIANLGRGGLVDPDEAPEPQAEVVSVLGDVWLLGRHRLVCGDCTDAGVVEVALGGARPHLMVTDPPYGVSHDPAWREERGVSTYGPQAKGLVANDDRADWRDAWTLFFGDVAYVWCASLCSDTAIQSLESVGLMRRGQIIWNKPQIIFGRSDYHWQHEPCWYAVRKSRTGHWAGDRKQSTVWTIDGMHVMGPSRGNTDNPVTGHSTQKPVECMKRPIENNSQPGDAVYEPFSGSGTTIIAAEMTGRACHAIEIEPRYVDVAIRRWQTFTGEVAYRERDGLAFADAVVAIPVAAQ